MKAAVVGACGRMGQEVVRQIAASRGTTLAAAIERAGHPSEGKDAGTTAGVDPLGVAITSDLTRGLGLADVAIDFSLPEGTTELARQLGELHKPAVLAVTALPTAARAAIDAAARSAPILVTSNLSMGASVLRLLSARAAQVLAEFDVEIIERHHRGKADAPSGTAIEIARAVARARGIDPDKALVSGRRPGEGARAQGTIGVHAVRGGTVTGEHEVVLLGERERLSLAHVAESREIFARGALRAARWLVGRPPALYSMDDLVADLLSS